MNFAIDLAIRSSLVACIGLAAVLAMRGFSARGRVVLIRGVCLALLTLPLLLFSNARVEVASPFPAEPVTYTYAPEPTATPVPARAEIPVWPILWAAGFLFVAIRHSASSYRLRKMWRTGQDATGAMNAEVADAMRSMNVRNQPRTRTGETPTPLVFGLAARVLLPGSFPEWLAERRRLALLHEAAHVRHRDSLWANLGHVVMALYWWNPLAWLVTRSLRIETELAADEAAIQSGFPGVRYAQTLLAIAQDSPVQAPVYACSLLGVGTLGRRVRAALRPAAPRSRFLPKAMMLTTALFVLATAVGGFAEPIQEAPPATPAISLPGQGSALAAPRQVSPPMAARPAPAFAPANPARLPRPAKAAKPAKVSKLSKPAKAPKAFRRSGSNPFANPAAPRIRPSAMPAKPPTPRADAFPAPVDPSARPTADGVAGLPGSVPVVPSSQDPLSRPRSVDSVPARVPGSTPAEVPVKRPGADTRPSPASAPAEIPMKRKGADTRPAQAFPKKTGNLPGSASDPISSPATLPGSGSGSNPFAFQLAKVSSNQNSNAFFGNPNPASNRNAFLKGNEVEKAKNTLKSALFGGSQETKRPSLGGNQAFGLGKSLMDANRTNAFPAIKDPTSKGGE